MYKAVLYENFRMNDEETVEFPVYELDIEAIAYTSLVFPTPVEGTPKNVNILYKGDDLSVLFPNWDDMPHETTEDGSLIKTKAQWTMSDGIRQCLDTTLTQVPQSANPPEDFYDNWMYYGTAYNEYWEVYYKIFHPLTYQTNWEDHETNKRWCPVWDGNTQYYYNNPENHDYRLARIFVTKAGYSYGISKCNRFFRATTYWADNNPLGGFCPHQEDFYSYFYYNYPFCVNKVIDKTTLYSRDGIYPVVYNPMSVGGVDDAGIAGQGANLQWYGGIRYYYNQYFVLVHFTYNNVEYVGYALINCGDDTAHDPISTTPTVVQIVAFGMDYWGDSLEPYEPPTPEQPTNWGDPSSPAGGNGTFDSSSDTLGDTSGTYITNLVADMNSDSYYMMRGNGFNLYELTADANGTKQLQTAFVMNKILRITYSGDYWDRFEAAKFNPMSSFLAYHLIPGIFSNVVQSTGTGNVTAGGYDFYSEPSSEYKVPKQFLISQYSHLHCGKISFNSPYFGAFPDFAPYTSMKLHLPYIGVIDIDVNSVMYGEISVDYICDLINGNLAAYITCKDREGKTFIKYVATGNCAYSLPIYSEFQSALTVGKCAISTVTSIATTAALGATSMAAYNASTAVPLPWQEAASGIRGASRGLRMMNSPMSGILENVLMGVPRQVNIQGEFSGNVGALMENTVWLEISRPTWVNPEKYHELNGAMSMISGVLTQFGSGFMKVDTIDLTGCSATEEEIEEIESILRSGFFYLPENQDSERSERS